MAKDGYWNSTLQRQVVQAIKDAQKVMENPPKASASKSAKKTSDATDASQSSSTPNNTNPSDASLEQALDRVLQKRFGLGANNPQGMGSNGLFGGQPMWGAPNMPAWGMAPVMLPLSAPPMMGQPIMAQGMQGFNPAAFTGFSQQGLPAFFNGGNGFAPPPLSPLQQWYQALLNAPLPSSNVLPQSPANSLGASSFLNNFQTLLPPAATSNSIFSSAKATTPAESSLSQLLEELKTMIEGIDTSTNKPAPVAASYEEQLMQLMMQRLTELGPQGKALELLELSLKASDGENNRDSDSFAVSQGDINTLKTALANKEVTPPQMTAAFQWLFTTAPQEALDELSVLFGKLVDQNVLKASPLLSSAYLGQLNEVSRSALTRGLANAGVMGEDKNVNTDLTGWMLQQLSAEDKTTAEFAKGLVTATAKAWTPYKDTEEGKQVFEFLKTWAGWQPATTEVAPKETVSV
jgi:hypothetical protein